MGEYQSWNKKVEFFDGFKVNANLGLKESEGADE